MANTDSQKMEHWVFPGCISLQKATYEDWKAWTLIDEAPAVLGPKKIRQVCGGCHSLWGGLTLHLSRYSTDDVVAKGNLLLERFPLSFALSQQLGSPAIILLLGKAEAASENTFALIGLFLQRVDRL